MQNIKNSDILKGILTPLYTITTNKTSEKFATTIFIGLMKTLEKHYDFLKHVKIKKGGYMGEGVIDIAPEIDYVDTVMVCKAIEATIRVLFMDLRAKTGLFFINELKEQAGEEMISVLKKNGIDMVPLEVQQRYIYRKYKKKIIEKKKEMGYYNKMVLLDYSWGNVTSWEYDYDNNICVLYNDKGNELDKIALDALIQKYVDDLTEDDILSPPGVYENEDIEINEKEIQLLKMLKSRDIDSESATRLLHVSKDELQSMINRLLQIDMLHYVSFDVVELTENAMNYLKEQEKLKIIE